MMLSTTIVRLSVSLILINTLQANFYNNDKDNLSINIKFGNFEFVIHRNNLSVEGCGISSAIRIVNGKTAVEGSYPFAVLLLFEDQPYGGAVIINDRWILTAAHNFHRSQKETDFTIGIGSVHINKLKIVNIEKILIHPQYKRKQKFDIALIKLEQQLKFSRTVRPVCLPGYSFQPVNSDRARIVGWGFSSFESRKVSQILQEIDLDIISLDKCKQIYSSIKQEIVRSQICTWSANKDACSGDSGGPLFVYKKDRAVLFGLVSFGVTCADEFPGVFTAVSYYLNWIDKIMQTH